MLCFGASTTMSMSLPGSITENSNGVHFISEAKGSRTDKDTCFSVMEPKGGCFAPVNTCFAVSQYSRESISIENIVPKSLDDLTITVRNRMLLVACADWADRGTPAIKLRTTTKRGRIGAPSSLRYSSVIKGYTRAC